MTAPARRRLITFALAALACAAVAAPAAQAAPLAGTAIHGGHATTIARYPWMVALEIDVGDGSALCGGSLITRTWVMTAAHCVTGSSPRDVLVISGSTRLEPTRARNRFSARRVVVHPAYNAANNANDIALVQLTRPASASVDPLGPDGARFAEPGDRGQSLGWGPTSNGSDNISNVLQVVTMPIYATSRCRTLPPTFNARIMICAGNGTTGTCKGDSGGPLVVNVLGRPAVAGIVSYGDVSGDSPCDVRPGAYTRVSAYRNFIARYAGDGIFTG